MAAVKFNWDIVWNIALIALWIWQARWTWLDAHAKYGRGPFFGLLALFLPGAGILFYFLYRESALMEIDMLDAETALEVSDTVQVSRTAGDRASSRDVRNMARNTGRFISRRDRRDAKELREKAAAVENENPLLAKELREKADLLDPPRPPRKPFRRRWKEFWIIQRDKWEIRRKRMRERREYLKRPKKLRKYDEFMERLQKTPVVDPTMEGLIFEGQYEVARERAIINLQIAEEAGDERKIITYRRYLDQIEKITHMYFPERAEEDETLEKYDMSGGGEE